MCKKRLFFNVLKGNTIGPCLSGIVCMDGDILVPRAHDPFGLRQGSRPLAGTRSRASAIAAHFCNR